MKKIIYVLVFALCFSCEKDVDNNVNNTANNTVSQTCGTITINVNHTNNETFSSNNYEVTCNSNLNELIKFNGLFHTLRLDFNFNCIYQDPNLVDILWPVREISFFCWPNRRSKTSFNDMFNYCRQTQR